MCPYLFLETGNDIESKSFRLILQPLHRFTYVTAHSLTILLLYLHHSSFYNPSVASSTSQLILQPFRLFIYATAHSKPFRRLTYVTGHSTTLPLLHLRNRHFTYFTWRAAHVTRLGMFVQGTQIQVNYDTCLFSMIVPQRMAVVITRQ